MADILVITQIYAPEPNFITADVAEMLADGSSVTVVTSHPNYPLGRFYPEVKSIRPTRTVENGVTVWRLPVFPDHSTSRVRRALSYLSFLFVAALWAPFVAGRPGLVWVYNTPITNYLAALPFRWLYRSRLVITCADLWPESMVASGVAEMGFVLRQIHRLSRWVTRSADLTICATKTIAQTFVKDGSDPARLKHVPVWTTAAEIDALNLPEAPPTIVPRVVYAGNMGEGQWLDPLMHAAAELQRRGARVHVDMYGDGTERARLQRLARDAGADNVTFHGTVSPDAAFAAASSAVAQVVALKPSALFRMTVPSKLMFSFAAGTPVLYCLEGEAAEIAAESGGGFRFAHDDVPGLVTAIETLLHQTPAERQAMRKQMQAYYTSRYSREHLLSAYRELLTQRTRRRRSQIAAM